MDARLRCDGRLLGGGRELESGAGREEVREHPVGRELLGN
jgi:hypothetical protein